jgi:hypothetical protein
MQKLESSSSAICSKIKFTSKREEAFDLDPPPDDVFSYHQ